MTDTQNRRADGATNPGSTTVTPRPHTDRAVVVGVDGSEHNRAAVEWATSEAEQTARPLSLVSVLDDYDIPIPHYSGATNDDRDWSVLRQFASDIARDRPRLKVSHEMVSDGTVRALLARSADQDLLVVGKRGLGTFSRALVGSTSIAVAGRSRVPVVIVPDGWNRSGHENEPVAVGLDPDDVHSEAVTWAFLEARRRGVTLIVAHGWETRSPLIHDPVAVSVDIAYWKAHGLERVSEAIKPFRAEYADVRVELAHRPGHPATVLLDVAETAQILVVGRHDDGRLGGFPYGSVTRSVLHHAYVPVAVIPSGRPR